MSDEYDYDPSDDFEDEDNQNHGEDADDAHDRWRDDAPSILDARVREFVKSVVSDKHIWYRERDEAVIKDAMSILSDMLKERGYEPHSMWREVPK